MNRPASHRLALRASCCCLSVSLLTACSADPGSVAGAVATTEPALAAKGSGGTIASIAMAGGIHSLARPDGTPVLTSINANAPFKNLALGDVRITLAEATQGDLAACQARMPNRTFSTSFGANAGTWVGGLSVWYNRTPAQSNFKFSGTRTVEGIVEQVQFTSNDDDAVQTTDGSTVTLTFTSAPLGFGSNSTHWELDANGLPVLRCVALTVTATR